MCGLQEVVNDSSESAEGRFQLRLRQYAFMMYVRSGRVEISLILQKTKISTLNLDAI